MPSTTDKVKDMRKEGYKDPDIINNLQQQGVSPREINNSLAQSQVNPGIGNPGPANLQGPEQVQEMGQGQMQPSISSQPQQPPMQSAQEIEAPEPGMQAPAPGQEMPQFGQTMEMQEPGYEEGYEEDYGGYGQEAYGEYEQGYGADTDTVSEIANQLIEEKTNKITKNMNALMEARELTVTKIEQIDDRLKKIEAVIDQLQMTLIRKATDQEQNIEDIKTEMKMMQTGFGKVINPLVDEVNRLEKSKRKTHRKTTSKTKTTIRKPKKVTTKKKTTRKKTTKRKRDEIDKILGF